MLYGIFKNIDNFVIGVIDGVVKEKIKETNTVIMKGTIYGIDKNFEIKQKDIKSIGIHKDDIFESDNSPWTILMDISKHHFNDFIYKMNKDLENNPSYKRDKIKNNLEKELKEVINPYLKETEYSTLVSLIVYKLYKKIKIGDAEEDVNYMDIKLSKKTKDESVDVSYSVDGKNEENKDILSTELLIEIKQLLEKELTDIDNVLMKRYLNKK